MSAFTTVTGIMSIVTFLLSVLSIVFSIVFKNRYKDRFVVIQQLISYLGSNSRSSRDARRFRRNLQTLTEMNHDIIGDEVKTEYLHEEN